MMVAASQGNLSIVQNLLDNGSVIETKISFESYIKLCSLKSKKSRNKDSSKGFQKSSGIINQEKDLKTTNDKYKVKDISAEYIKEKGICAVEMAAANGHFEIVKLLLSKFVFLTNLDTIQRN